MSVTNYSVNDHQDYDWKWIYIPPDKEDPRREAVKRERETLRKKLVRELVGDQSQA